jgi:16S rRNA (guanine(966)-N(2))-methyltransferase RsmD
MLRIIAGTLGGRRIATPKGAATRPTAEKVRGALFNVLEDLMALEGALVVDLYAGSGALGFEALSRGAARVTFVEASPRAARLIRQNAATLGAARRVDVVAGRARAWLARPPQLPPATLVLADPPYAAGEYGPLLEALAAWPGAAPGAVIAVEAPARLHLPLPRGLELVRVKRYGDTQLLITRKRGAAPAAASPDPAGGMP